MLLSSTMNNNIPKQSLGIDVNLQPSNQTLNLTRRDQNTNDQSIVSPKHSCPKQQLNNKIKGGIT